WEQRKLREIVIDTIDNRGKNPPYYCESGIPIIDNFMIKNNGYPNLKIATRYLDSYLFDNFIRKYNEVDDVLITLVGNGIGNIALFPKEKSAIIQNTIGLRFNENKKFMYYSLLSKNDEIIKLDRGMAQPSIRQDELKDIDINLPSVIEQNKIANIMTNIDNLITLHQH
ncbi:MAG: restriction endonuclease subunit S, partial [Bacilli bacterium]